MHFKSKNTFQFFELPVQPGNGVVGTRPYATDVSGTEPGSAKKIETKKMDMTA
jgi:hypothetical protein